MDRFRSLMLGLAGWLLLAATSYADPPVRLISQEIESEIRAMLPPIADSDAAKVLLSDDLIWYSEIEVPKAYQFENAFHTPYFNIADPREQPDKYGNANREFPWNEAGGADLVENLEVYRFVKFPKREDGRYYPMIYYRQLPPGVSIGDGAPNNSTSTWRWMYPKGTVFGEIMCMVGPDKLLYPFELRTRMRGESMWHVDALRPFTSADELATRIKQLRPDWQTSASLVRLVRHLETKLAPAKATIADHSKTNTRHTGRVAFNKTVAVDPLPPISDRQLVVDLLLSTPWQSATAAIWRTGTDSAIVHAPTVAKGDGFHIVPENYRAHAFTVDDVSCMQCHAHTNMTARTFDEQRGWWGRVRGDDGIFSFHPFTPASINVDGINRQPRIRQDLIKAGLVQAYNTRAHTSPIYTKLSTR